MGWNLLCTWIGCLRFTLVLTSPYLLLSIVFNVASYTIIPVNPLSSFTLSHVFEHNFHITYIQNYSKLVRIRLKYSWQNNADQINIIHQVFFKCVKMELSLGVLCSSWDKWVIMGWWPVLSGKILLTHFAYLGNNTLNLMFICEVNLIV